MAALRIVRSGGVFVFYRKIDWAAQFHSSRNVRVPGVSSLALQTHMPLLRRNLDPVFQFARQRPCRAPARRRQSERTGAREPSGTILLVAQHVEFSEPFWNE